MLKYHVSAQLTISIHTDVEASSVEAAKDIALSVALLAAGGSSAAVISAALDRRAKGLREDAVRLHEGRVRAEREQREAARAAKGG